MLNEDIKIPLIGLATPFIPENELKDAVKCAVMEKGIRLIDTPHIPSREKIIGEALKECFDSGIKREDMFIIAKCEIWDEDKVHQALKDSLSNLQLNYVDMYMLYNLVPKLDPKTLEVQKFSIQDCWRQMEHCHGEGLCRTLGLGCCPVVMLMDILAYCEVKPALNLIEIHPYFNQKDVIDFHRKLDIDVASFSPLPPTGEQAKTGVFKNLMEKIPKNLQEKIHDIRKNEGFINFTKKY